MALSAVTSSKSLRAKVRASPAMEQERQSGAGLVHVHGRPLMKQLHVNTSVTQLAVKELPVQAVQAVKKGKSIFFTTVSCWRFNI